MLLRNEPHRDRAALQRTRWTGRLGIVWLRDTRLSSRHSIFPTRAVLAAAIAGRCDAASNLRHFPNATVEPFGIRHPDEFLCDRLEVAPGAFCEATRKVRGRLKKPPFIAREYPALSSHNPFWTEVEPS